MPLISSARTTDAFSTFLEQNLRKDLLRFTTAGSVDDGKSTLIGHLLHDAKAVYEDQLASVKRSRINRSGGPLDFSLITDGLRAEREQGITIDVGYRYFATSHRKFIIADAPGHEQYTRNMATGASTADLAVILLDATKGLLAQTLRHTYIASLLGIRHVLAAVNKMDLVDYREDVFAQLQEKTLALAAQLEIPDVQCIPVSALEGDNVVHRSERMAWYGGPTMLEHLESVPVGRQTAGDELRLPVQIVLRPDATFRGFAGRLASGQIGPGDEVLALPSGQVSRVTRIVAYEEDLKEAFAPQSVAVQLEDEIDLSRGDMLVSPHARPRVSKHFSAMVVWLHEQGMEPGREYFLKHTTRLVRARPVGIRHRVNVGTLEKEEASELNLNDIGLVEFSANLPVYFDRYKQNRTTGSFILIDPLSNATVGAGMIREDLSTATQARSTLPVDAVALAGPVSATERHTRNGHIPSLLIHRGSTGFAARAERLLFDEGLDVFRLAGNAVSHTNSRAAVQSLLEAGVIVLASAEDLGDAAIAELKSSESAPVYELDGVASQTNEDAQLESIFAIARNLKTGKGKSSESAKEFL